MESGFKWLRLTGILALGFYACADGYLYEAEKKIANEKWAYADTLDFVVPVADTTQLYNLYIAFTHADTFSSQNVYVKLYTRFPDGKRVQRIRSFDLFDAQGNPNGDCSGKKCETKILLQDRLYFNQLGDYQITLEQFSRENPLGGIQSVGIMLEKTKQKK